MSNCMVTKLDKSKQCKVCGNEFYPRTTLQKVCNIKCAIVLAHDRQEKKEQQARRKWKQETRKRLKTKSQWLKETQVVFNKYIRLRDLLQPCISCGRNHSGQIHAGHYRSVGACPELRFDEDNVHAQCAPCNNHLSGNIVEYRINLEKKIGKERLAKLEGPHEAKHYTIEEIQEIKQQYKLKIQKLQERQDAGGIGG